MNKKRIIGILLTALIAVVAVMFIFNSKWQFERYVKAAEHSPTILIDSFASFQKSEDVTSQLRAKGLKWEVTSDSKSLGDNFRPEFNELIIRIPNYQHMETSGTLDLAFNNNRLYQATFYPSDLSEYFKKFKAKFNQELDIGKKVKFDDTHTSVEVLKDFQEKVYIRWVDERILNEVSEWIKRFS